jgi:ribosome-binding ATPase YchF (GTP1/OBG family)
MKACVVGITDFPLGKKPLPEERLKQIEQLYKAQKVTTIQVEYVSDKDIKTADAIVCPAGHKLDLIVRDMEVVEARLEKPLSETEADLLRRAQQLLEKEEFLNGAAWSEEERKTLLNINLVTLKPVVLTGEADALDLPALTRRVYDASGRIVFLTGGPKEARAWEIRRGATAVDAAGAIHSDIARGFIRAEVMRFEDLVKAGNVHQARTSGCLRQENKGYVVCDGDVIDFKFSV